MIMRLAAIRGTEKFATVGISFGLDVIYTAMMLDEQKSRRH